MICEQLPMRYLLNQETICQGHFEDLKVERTYKGYQFRYWLSRCGPEDGMESAPINVEIYRDDLGWVNYANYGTWAEWEAIKKEI